MFEVLIFLIDYISMHLFLNQFINKTTYETYLVTYFNKEVLKIKQALSLKTYVSFEEFH